MVLSKFDWDCVSTLPRAFNINDGYMSFAHGYYTNNLAPDWKMIVNLEPYRHHNLRNELGAKAGA